MRTAIYPGTFDPITLGHMDIIRRALRVTDRLVIGVAEDSAKQPAFDAVMRAQMVEADIATLPAVDQARVSVRYFAGLLVNFAAENNATLLVRGLRAVSDFEYEFQMANINSKLNPMLETVFLTASETTHFISSRFVKQIARLGGDISHFVSPAVAEKLREYFSN